MGSRLDLLLIEAAVRHFEIIPKIFFEIGSRDGDDTAVIKQKFNLEDKNCYIFEPHPISFENIKKKYPRFNVCGIALYNETKQIAFNAIINEEDNIGMSSILNKIDDELKEEKISEKIFVDAWRLDDLLKEIDKVNIKIDKIDICKIDVEGVTFEVLEGFGERLKDVKIIQLEVENKSIWKNQILADEIDKFLIKNGFSIFGYFKLCDEQSDVCYINKNLLT